MSISKRRGRYQVKVRGPEGWWTCTLDTKQDAERAEREMRRARDLGIPWVHPRHRSAELTIRRMCERYIEANRPPRLAANTWRLHGRMLERFTCWAEERRRARARHLTRRLIEEWHASLVEDGLMLSSARSTAQAPISMWRWAWNYAAEEGWEEAVPPWRRPQIPRGDVPIALAPSLGEVDQMIGHLRPSWEARSALLQRFLGSRIGETMLLRWADVDLAKLWITFQPETTKGRYGGRVVPIHPQLAELLAGWERTADHVVGDAQQHVSSGYPAKRYRMAWALAEVRPGAWEQRPTHAIRKAVKTELRRQGADADAVDILLGHRLRETTSRYVDPSAWPLREVVELLPRMADPPKV